MTIRQIRHGLVEQAKLLLLNGLEQSLLQQHPLPGLCRHVGGVEQIAVAATALGFMHGVVRRADKAVRGLAMLRIEGDADAGGEPHPLLADVGGIVQPVLQPFDQPHQFLRLPDAWEQHQKLVRPQPDGDVSGAQAVANAVCRQLEQQIAGTVPQVVVDELEAVEIDEQQRQDVVVHPGRLYLQGEALLQQMAIAEIGEGIVIGEVLQAGFGLIETQCMKVGHLLQAG